MTHQDSLLDGWIERKLANGDLLQHISQMCLRLLKLRKNSQVLTMSTIKALACLRQQQGTQINNIGCPLSHDNDDVWVVEIVRQ